MSLTNLFRFQKDIAQGPILFTQLPFKVRKGKDDSARAPHALCEPACAARPKAKPELRAEGALFESRERYALVDGVLCGVGLAQHISLRQFEH